jgi:hypothetical protein
MIRNFVLFLAFLATLGCASLESPSFGRVDSLSFTGRSKGEDEKWKAGLVAETWRLLCRDFEARCAESSRYYIFFQLFPESAAVGYTLMDRVPTDMNMIVRVMFICDRNKPCRVDQYATS